jgi:hypothetical protein
MLKGVIIGFGKDSKYGSGTLIGSLEVLRGKEQTESAAQRWEDLLPHAKTDAGNMNLMRAYATRVLQPPPLSARGMSCTVISIT